MEKPIASLDLISVDEEGLRSKLALSIGAPSEEPDGTWACEVELEGIESKPRKIYGGDSLQALCLAMQYMKKALELHSKASRLLYAGQGEDAEWPIESYLHFH